MGRLLLCLLWFQTVCCATCAQPDTVTLEMLLRAPSLEALDSYPQRVTDINREGEHYRLRIRIVDPLRNAQRMQAIRSAMLRDDNIYGPEEQRYLQSTALIDVRNEQIGRIADTLFAGEHSVLRIIRKGVACVSRLIQFDDSLARAIDAGHCRTLDAATILQRRKGTCSEYANLFIALMRRKGIPCRFVVGYVYMPERNYTGTHAWAECFIPGVGWHAVEPQSGAPGFPHTKAVKMREGLDFEDCRIRSLRQDIEPLEIRRE